METLAATRSVEARERTRYRREWAAYRKVLRAASAARALLTVAVASALLAFLGFALYLLVYPSGIVLFEALVWSIEAMTFLGVWLALRVAASRAAFYKARYEIFRVEALMVTVLSLIGLAVSGVIVYKAVSGGHEPTPVVLSLYPLGSAAASYVLESMLHRRLGSLEFKIVSIHAVASKLRYDVFIEAAGGVAIIASNLLHEPLVESLLVAGVAVYVSYGLLLLAYEHLLYLVGPGPAGRRRMVRERILREATKLGVRVVRLRVEVYGTFSEAEVWIAMDPGMRLGEAHRVAQELARHLVHRVPDLLRVLVIPVPGARRRRAPRGHARYRRVRGGQPGGGNGGHAGHSPG